MSNLRTTLIVAGALSAGVGLSTARLCADQIRLTNGNVIEGTVVSEGERVVVQIGDVGRMLLKASEVASIMRTDADPAEEPSDAPAGRWVAVTLKSGNEYYGNGVYTGQLSDASDDQKVILEIAGGKITIPRDAVAEIADVDAPVERTEAPATVTTTHRLHMKNGRILRGNLLPSAEDAPYLVAFGDLGVMKIARRDVERIEEAEDTIELPQPVEEPVEEPAEAPMTIEELREQIRQEVREEILRELLGAAAGDRLQVTIPATRLTEEYLRKELAGGLLNEEILEIEFLVRELGRQRTNNRVRAERKLGDFGPAALPFLCGPAVHPFDLTRRAVQRIVRDIGDFRGAPLSIAALDDEDPFVRSLAHDALRELLPGARISYHADAPPRQRVDAQAGYWQLWEDILLNEARDIVLDQVAANAPR